MLTKSLQWSAQTTSPAIARYAVELLETAGLALIPKETFIAQRRPIIVKKSAEEVLSADGTRIDFVI